MMIATLVSLVAVSMAPGLVGDWDGALTVPAGIEVPLVLHLGAQASTIDSPDQNASGVAVVATSTPTGVTIVTPASHAQFDGTLSPDGRTLAGPFRQGGMTMTARFTKRAPGVAAAARRRPQTPQPPFPYEARDVTVSGGPVPLAGTLTLPRGAGPFPAAVMIAGSGPQNRDETVEGHRIFLVIADRLARAGIAVLRYDKRGVGASGGRYGDATQADFTADATAALRWLRTQPGIRPAGVGLIGHSEGAEIAPAVADADGHVAFAVLLSTPAETGAETIASQAHAIALASGLPPARAAEEDKMERAALAAVAAAPDSASAETTAARVLRASGMPSDRAASEARIMAAPWYRAFLNDDPLPALRALAVPALVVAGSKDMQVLPDRNLPLLRRALAGKRDVEIVELPGLNHLLQPAVTGLPAEYGQIETTIDPGALDLITDWVVRTVR